MPSVASLLVTASTAILFVLGALHLFYTFHGTKLHPRQAGVVEAMQRSALRITHGTTVWRAWIGFNASHSLGILLYALVYAYLALVASTVPFGSVFLCVVGFALLLSYVVLAGRYWFTQPFRGVVIATPLYPGGLAAAVI